jgi:hypothetical protein
MVVRNPQTYVRLKRNELRQFANHIGTLAMNGINHWPSTGEGRSVKANAEAIIRRLTDRNAIGDLKSALTDLSRSIEDFKIIQVNPYFRAAMSDARYQLDADRWRTTGGHLVSLIRDTEASLSQHLANLPPEPSLADRLTALAPEQQVAPVKLEFVNGILRVRHEAATAQLRDRSIAEAARAELLESGDAILRYLREANFESRIVEAVDDIVQRVAIRQDIVRVGIAAISFQMIIENAAEELPSYWSARLKGYAVGVSMYVSQHIEWIQFSENSASAEYDDVDARHLYSIGTDLARQLKASPEEVDEEVAQSLLFVMETIKDPRRAIKKTVYAAVTSISNVAAAIIRKFGYIINGFTELSRQTMDSAGIKLLAIAGSIASKITPIAGRFLHTQWLVEAGKMIKQALNDKN